MKYVLDFRDRDIGGAVLPGLLTASGMTHTQALDALRLEKRVVFLLHGFKVNRCVGKMVLGNLAHDLGALSNTGLIAVLWPGDHALGFLSYPFEGRDADDTARELAEFINLNLNSSTPISFVAHSLGARVAMETAKQLEDSNPIENVCLMAAAIDDYSVSAWANYRAVVQAAKTVAVLSSRKDTVLRYAYPIGDLLQAFIYLRDTYGLALGYGGPRPHSNGGVPDSLFHCAIPSQLKVCHDDYLRSDNANCKQRSAAKFARQVISGRSLPHYSTCAEADS